jgi:hypothetical protein
MEEIQSELKEIRRILKDVNYQMQELREGLGRTSFPAPMLPMPQPYQYTWGQYQRPGLVTCGNNLGSQDQASESINLDQTGSGISGATQAA